MRHTMIDLVLVHGLGENESAQEQDDHGIEIRMEYGFCGKITQREQNKGTCHGGDVQRNHFRDPEDNNRH